MAVYHMIIAIGGCIIQCFLPTLALCVYTPRLSVSLKKVCFEGFKVARIVLAGQLD